jgi:hypothetical protein
MCDYSLQSVKSRPAAVGDKIITKNFGTGTTGFAEQGASEPVAVCVLPGTEIAFDEPVALGSHYAPFEQTQYRLARFRQVNKETERAHHDAVEFPDGRVELLTRLDVNQRATVLQLPAIPKTQTEAEDQRRVAFAG